MKQTTLVVVCVLGLVSIGTGWREYQHGNLARDWEEEREQMLGQQQDLAGQLKDATLQAEALATDNQTLKIDLESLGDRCTNLTAQRDHLKAENERQSNLATVRSEALKRLDRELQTARHQMLVQAGIPQELEAELAQSRLRIQSLEEQLDQQSTMGAKLPLMHSVEGISTDGTVVALSGSHKLSGNLPRPIRLCRRNETMFTGWINRIEEGTIILHVNDWQEAPSTLVKGEKVFILPDRSHESDP